MPSLDERTEEERREAGRSTLLEGLPFPELDISEAFRIHGETFLAPDASVGSGHVTLVRPEIGVRVTAPVTERLVLRLVVRGAESRYRFGGDVWGAGLELPFEDAPDPDLLIGHALDLHAARASLEGMYRLTEHTNWLADGEQWGLLGSATISSRWEDGGFDSGLAAGFAVGVGYEVPDYLRVGVGAAVRTPLEQTDFEVDPFITLRWRPQERVTMKTRGLGLQVEIGVTPSLDFYLAGFRSNERFRLQDRFGPIGDLSFRDRHLRFGLGFDAKFAKWFRVGVEAGGITDRSLRVTEEDLGTLLSRRVDSSGYFEIRFELRL